MDLRRIRIARLKKLAARHGIEEGDNAALAVLIGKKPNQVYNLLNQRASFGEKVARSIEANAGLPPGWLDVDESVSKAAPLAFSPEAIKIATDFDSLKPSDRARVMLLWDNTMALARQKQKSTSDKASDATRKRKH